MKTFYSTVLLTCWLALAAHAQQHQNLLANPGTAFDILDGWDIMENGGDGWVASSGQGISGSSCFVTSYGICRKSQTIDLVAKGYTPDWLDTAPIVLFSDWYKSGQNGSADDTYYLLVQLLDANYNVIESFSSGDVTTAFDWQQIKGSFLNYGPGVRYIYFEHGGIDGEFWAGNYGAAMDAAYLSIGNNLYYSGGHTGDQAGWDISVNGGDGWGTIDPGNYGYKMYITSYFSCYKSQTIDLLAQGYTAQQLNLQPLVSCSNWVLGSSPAYNDLAHFNVTLLDANMNPIEEYQSGEMTCSDQWQLMSANFTNYGPGLRYIKVEHGGIDAEFWAGQYGAIFDDVEVNVDLSIVNDSHEADNGDISFNVYPNPSNGIFKLAFGPAAQNEVEVLVTDRLGRIVLKRSFTPVGSQLNENIDVAGVPAGTYFVRVTSEEKSAIKQLIVNGF